MAFDCFFVEVLLYYDVSYSTFYMWALSGTFDCYSLLTIFSLNCLCLTHVPIVALIEWNVSK